MLKSLGKIKADEEPLCLSVILQSNGLDDALWALRCLEGADREIRLFAVEVAREVQHLMADPRSLAALDMAERFANGLATSAELAAAWDAARDAASDAADAAWVAAVAADTARDAAWDPSWVAAKDAADAAKDAAMAAAWGAADAARGAARGAARTAADAARTKQAEIFLKYFG